MSFLRRNFARAWRRALALNDYRVFRAGAAGLRRLAKRMPAATEGSVLIVSGRGMNVLWAQIWPVLGLGLAAQGYAVKVITTRRQRLLNAYYRLLGVELIFLDALRSGAPWPIDPETEARLAGLRSFQDYSAFSVDGAPVGQIALSTYSRHEGTGLIDLADPRVAGYVKHWVREILIAMRIARHLYAEHDVKILFFSEVFMEEYGAFYYAAIAQSLNVIRFAGTVRDDAYILQHLSRDNDRIHHSSIDPTTWRRLKSSGDDRRVEAELTQNFIDRYGAKWHRSHRNHPNTRMLDAAQARRLLGVSPGRKVAVIYSHILYDTLFFFGTDLFKDYAEWLVETVRAAVDNPRLDWLVKVHPSNLWRGELDTLLKGRYEEERLLARAIGDLPAHVRIVPPDTPINPYALFQFADFGITVRGTSGLEMAALGKTVVTAGTGRYEGNGFTLDPASAEEYLALLRRLDQLPPPSAEQARLARRYAHAIFVMKPYELKCLDPRLRSGKRRVRASDDLIYVPRPLRGNDLPDDVAKFAEWALDIGQRDLLTEKSQV